MSQTEQTVQNRPESGVELNFNLSTVEGVPCSTHNEKVRALRNVTAFADLPDDQLEWFAARTEERCLDAGDILFRRGDAPEWMVVMLTGETHARPDDNTLDGRVYIARAGDPATEITGKLPFSRMKIFEATGRAAVPTQILLFPSQLFPELLQKMPLLAERLVWNMSDRVRESTKIDEQRDRLMALGKLSAGLAHELNNPAAAAARAANELLTTLENLRETDLRLCRHHLSNEARAFINEFERQSVERDRSHTALSPLQQSDREEELGEWLDARGIEEAWTFAPVLVEAEIKSEMLDELRETVGDEALGDTLARVSAQLQTARLVADIGNSAGRISALVGAIKEYSYMDRAPVQDVDVHKALEDTLLILKHETKKKNTQVVRDYDPLLPKITAMGRELNQMFTNLIENAIDAMPQGGTLTLATKHEPDAILIEICDNGAGIPPAVQQRIFEPFFTTKGVGEGTGLGLDTVARIVRQHHGNIRFESQPGNTRFQIRLPLTQEIVVKDKQEKQ